jgi:hypothetical protein
MNEEFDSKTIFKVFFSLEIFVIGINSYDKIFLYDRGSL